MSRQYLLPLALIVTLISACSRYSVSINENLVYEPPPLFGGYDIRDIPLKTCLQDTIAEEGLTRAEQLVRLICPTGEIAELAGIEVFGNLQQLGLANNRISDITVLATLKNLQQLNVKNNNVRDFSPLRSLEQLSLLNAAGNDNADCESFDFHAGLAKITLPDHCRSASL